MNCARYRDLISRYVDDEVTARQRHEVLEHVQHCHDCAAYLARARQADLLLRGVPETKPSDRVRQAVISSAMGDLRRVPQAVPPHPGLFPAGSGWRLYASSILMRFDLSPSRIAVAGAALLLAVIGMGYWAGIIPPLTGYDKFGFLYPQERTQAQNGQVPATPVPAISSGANGVGGTLASPNLVSMSPAKDALGIAPGAGLQIRFDQPMDRASVEDALRVDPPAAGAFSWEADNEVRFVPAEPGLLRGVTYTAVLTTTARSLAGRQIESPVLWQFHTTPPHDLVPVLAVGSEIAPTSTLSLVFDAEMDRGSALRTVALRSEGADDEVPVSQVWDAGSRTLSLKPLAPMPQGKVWLSVGGEARTQAGDTIGRAASFEYTVGLPSPRLRLVDGRFSAARAAAPAPVRYEALAGPGAPAGEVAFDLYRLPGDRLSLLGVRPMEWPSSLPKGFPATLEKVASFKSGDAWAAAGVRTAQAPALAPGTYLLVAEAGSSAGQMRDWQVLAVADRWLDQTAGGYSLWAVDNLGRGWAGAEVSLYSAQWSLLAKGVANSAGVYTLPAGTGAVYAVARDLDGHLASLVLDPRAPSAARSRGTLAADLLTDRPAYRPGETVQFRAVLHPSPATTWSSPITEQGVSVRLLTPQGLAVSALTLKPDSAGGVGGLFALAPGASPGDYVVRVESAGAGRDFPLRVESPARDGLSVYAAPAAAAGDSQAVTYTVSVLGSGGLPADGALLTATLGIEGDAWASAPVTATTGADGRAVVTLDIPSWALAYDEPGLQFRVSAQSGGRSGSTSGRLELLPLRRAQTGVGDLISPSLDFAAVAQPQKGGGTRLRVVSLDASRATDLLVEAVSPSGEVAAWAVDMATSGGDVTLPLGPTFAGGDVFFRRAGTADERRLRLSPPQDDNLSLAVEAGPALLAGSSFPARVTLLDREGQGLESVASLWFRRVGSSDASETSRYDWEPALRIEASGVATATLTAPDLPGLWLVMCEASTAEGAYTRAWAAINVQGGPVLQLPPVEELVDGRESTLQVTVYNPRPSVLSSGVRAEGRGPLDILGTSSQSVDVPAGGWQRLTWRVRPSRPDPSSITFSFNPSASVDSSWRLDLPGGGAPNASDTTYTAGVARGQRTVGVQVPSGLSGEQVQLEIRASTSLLDVLDDAAFDGTPGATTAAWAARLSMAPAVLAALHATGAEPRGELGASNLLLERSLALQQLYAAQRADGGWGSGLDASGASTVDDTALVLLALKRQSSAWAYMGGEPQPVVDGQVVARALSYLRAATDGPLPVGATGDRLDSLARALYVRSLYGGASLDGVRSLMAFAGGEGDSTAGLSGAGRAWLALALLQLGDRPDAAAIVGRLAQDAPAGAQQAAPMLEALLTAGSQAGATAPGLQSGDLAQAYLTTLMEGRHGAAWEKPEVSADAVSALALYGKSQGEKPGGSPVVTLNDRTVQASGSDGSSSLTSMSVTIAGGSLPAGTNWLKLLPPSNRPLYYSLTLRASR